MAPRDGPRTLVPITITSTNVDQEWKVWWPLNISLQAIINTIEDLTHHHAPDHRLDWNGRDLFSDLSKPARDISLWHVCISPSPSHSFTQPSTPRPPDPPTSFHLLTPISLFYHQIDRNPTPHNPYPPHSPHQPPPQRRKNLRHPRLVQPRCSKVCLSYPEFGFPCQGPGEAGRVD